MVEAADVAEYLKMSRRANSNIFHRPLSYQLPIYTTSAPADVPSDSSASIRRYSATGSRSTVDSDLHSHSGHAANAKQRPGAFSRFWNRLTKSVSFYSAPRVSVPSVSERDTDTVKSNVELSKSKKNRNRLSLNLSINGNANRSDVLSVGCVSDLRTPLSDCGMTTSFHSHFAQSTEFEVEMDPNGNASETVNANESTQTATAAKCKYQSKTLDRKSRRNRKLDHLFSWLNRRFHSTQLANSHGAVNLDESNEVDRNGNDVSHRAARTETGCCVLDCRPAVLRSQSCTEERPLPANGDSPLRLLFCVPDGDAYEPLAYDAPATSGTLPSNDASSETGIYATIAFPHCVTLTPKHRPTRKLPDTPTEQSPAPAPTHVLTTQIASQTNVTSDRESLCDDIEPYGELNFADLSTQLNSRRETDSRPASLVVNQTGMRHSHSTSSSTSSGRFSCSASPCSPEILTDDIALPPTRRSCVGVGVGVGVGVYSSIRRVRCAQTRLVDIDIDIDNDVGDTEEQMSNAKDAPPPLPRRTYRDDELNALFVELLNADAFSDSQEQSSSCPAPSCQLEPAPFAWYATERIYESISNLNLDNDADECNSNSHLRLLQHCDAHVPQRGTQSSESSGHGECSSLSSDAEFDERSMRTTASSDCRSEQSDKLAALNSVTLMVDKGCSIELRRRCVLLDELDKLRFIDSDAESVYSLDGCMCERNAVLSMSSSSTPFVSRSSRIMSASRDAYSPSRIRKLLVRHCMTANNSPLRRTASPRVAAPLPHAAS